jgi:hypothetical protein
VIGQHGVHFFQAGLPGMPYDLLELIFDGRYQQLREFL